MSESSPSTFPYANPASRWGVSSQRRPEGLRVIVPPVPGWRYLPRWYIVILPLTTFMALSPIVLLIRFKSAISEFLPPLIIYGSITLCILTHAFWRLHQRTIIDVTRDELAIVIVGLWGRWRRTAWPKQNIGEVKHNISNGKLLIRVIGQDYVEYFLSTSPEITQSVAEEVSHSIFHDQFQPSSPTDPFSWPVPRRRSQRFGLIVGFIIAAVLLVLGSFIRTLGGDWPGLGGMLIFLAFLAPIITAGIILGTQDKDFFF